MKKKATKKKAAKTTAATIKSPAGVWVVELRAKPRGTWRLTFLGQGFWETRTQAYAASEGMQNSGLFHARVRRYTP